MTKTRRPPLPPSDPTPPRPDGGAAGRRFVRDLLGRELRVLAGRPIPLGIIETRHGLNFAVFSANATALTLVLFASRRDAPVLELPLDGEVNRTGHVWHVEVAGLDPGTRYGWRAARTGAPDAPIYRFDPDTVLVDPYATALTGGSRWAETPPRAGENGPSPFPRRRSLSVSREFDWDGTRPPRIPLADKVIYELHVRGFTQHPSAGVAHPGTYLGLIEMIPYLQELGVTTVELLPVYEFDELENPNRNPLTGEPLVNFWGYSPINFFAPKAAYAADGYDGAQVTEFRTMVREFHRAGLEVFLDVVFNHTAEGALPADAPALSLRGLDNAVYYILDPETGAYRDYSGCGNTLNCNHPVVRNLILEALRYWVAEMHVDGFRFDLASILSRAQDGEVLPNPPVLERIAYDAVLADSAVIAEAWDAAGLYQVGRFPAWRRWAEWNGPFRDELRRFVRGDGGVVTGLVSRLAGSADLFEHSGRTPAHSINFVTCHDGFTLADLVAYDHKHNEANGESNRDGADDNLSWNGGVEGPTGDPAIAALRRRQVRNFLTLLLCAQGTPMLLAGDEFGRTQHGNNNAYCQDNGVSWVDWSLRQTNADLFRFTKMLIAFRRAHAVLRHGDFLTGEAGGPFHRPDVMWHGVDLNAADFGAASRSLAMHLAGEHADPPDCDIYLAANAWQQDLVFALPAPQPGAHWVRVVDTAAASPDDIAAPGSEPRLDGQTHVAVRARSIVVLRSAT
ncbi:MAG: glycogen debranching protein GlgX [bacterium]